MDLDNNANKSVMLMKSYFYKSLLVCAASATVGGAYSLYDSAPMVGLPESHNIKYRASIGVGYDSNVNWSENDEDASPYVKASVSALYADMESVNKLRYNVRLGLTHYTGLDSNSWTAETRGDCGLDVDLVHALDSANTLSSSLRATYSPQPNYADGYSPAYSIGDMLTVSQSNVYSHALDSRWSLNGSVSFQMIRYMEEVEQNDDRYYISGGVGAQYRESSIMTYKVNLSYSRELRSKGLDSDRYVSTVGFQRALDPFSSCGADVGVAVRVYSVETVVSPCANFSYRRKLSEGLNARVYLAYADENTGSYTSSQTYLKNRTLRFGSNFDYVLSPDVTYTFGAVYLVTNRSDATRGARDCDCDRYEISAGIDYAFTQQLRGQVKVSYSVLSQQYEGVSKMSPKRWDVSTGFTYNF